MMNARRLRLLLELACAGLVLSVMMTVTPVGGIIRGAYEYVTGKDGDLPPLASYFSVPSSDSDAVRIARQLASVPTPGSKAYEAATRAGLDPHLARAVVVVSSGGKLAVDGDAQVRLSKTASAAFARVGLKPLPPNSAPAVRRDWLLQGMSKLSRRLASEDAALAALVADLDQVEFALDRARAAGAADASTLDGFARYLSPRSRKRAVAFASDVLALRTAYGMGNPVRTAHRVTSRFGWRKHPVLGQRKLHTGIDVAIPTGTGLHAVAAGKVVYAAEDSVNGKFVKIDHGNGLTSAYCHASKLIVSRGDRVAKGAKIALSGATGRATGPHLHFQVEIDRKPVDPELFIRTFGRPVASGGQIHGHGGGLAAAHAHVLDHRRGHHHLKEVLQLESDLVEVGVEPVRDHHPFGAR